MLQLQFDSSLAIEIHICWAGWSKMFDDIIGFISFKNDEAEQLYGLTMDS